MDLYAELATTTISCLDDGFVRLVDCYPRYVPVDSVGPRTLEFRIVESARISTGQNLKSRDADNQLLNYLYRHSHTSPFESVKFTFHLRVPKFVRTHFIRHRTANVNEFSQRYAEIKDDAFYRPSKCPEMWKVSSETGTEMIRTQSSVNKQGSSSGSGNLEIIQAELEKMESLLDQCFQQYHRLLELGLPRELARFGLPDATYTEMYYTIDLHNLLKMLKLRADRDHAQLETAVYAEAMLELITPLVPEVIKLFENHRHGMYLSRDEVEAIHTDSELKSESKSEVREFQDKLKKL